MMFALALLCGGLMLGAASAADVAPSAGAGSQAAAATRTAADAGGSLQACAAYAYTAIKQHKVVTATPTACEGLSRAQVSQAAIIAISMTMTRSSSKSVRRRQEGIAAQWVLAMITSPAPAGEAPLASSATVLPSAGGPVGGLGLGGVSELAARVGALLAWLATAASGGWVLARWLFAGGSPLRRTTAAAPPAVILAHASAGALGLGLWAAFMLSGWVVLAWIALGMLAPVAGLGMGVLLLGLPRPVRPPLGARRPGRLARIPALAIVAHGLFAVTALLLVLMATVGAG